MRALFAATTSCNMTIYQLFKLTMNWAYYYYFFLLIFIPKKWHFIPKNCLDSAPDHATIMSEDKEYAQ